MIDKMPSVENANVKTRQVLRRREFDDMFAFVSGEFGGEVRSRRRKIARNRVRLARAERKLQSTPMENE